MTAPSAPADDPARSLRELVAAGRFQEALEAHRRTADPAVRQRPEVQLLVATAATRLGELTLGVSLAESALERFRARADRDGRMRTMNLIGAIAFEHGRLPEAEQAFGEALELARELDDSLMTAHASNNLASVAHLRSDPEVALSLYRSALLAYLRLGDRRGTAQTYHNLGLTFWQMTEWPDAESSSLQAVRHAEQVGERSLLALAVTGRAEIHLGRGELAMARQELDRAAQLAREAGDEIGGAEVGRLRALLALQLGDSDQAAQQAELARTTAERLGSALLQGECAAVAGGALRRLNRRPEAETRREEAARIFKMLGAVRLLERLNQEWEMG